ncbi:MAG TPA: hypothetical protein DCP31_28380 [Cyanobacteria bacterium UBA8543]|nr:hypothetical protein [Cyanobacteria bacterium UBA8543]
MFSDRLSELEKHLKLLYEQRNALEEGALMTPDDEKRMQNEQKIRDKIRPKIREYEQEYLQELKQRAVGLTFREEDAQTVIDVVAQEVERVERKVDTYPDEYQDRVIQLLQEIKTKLEAPQPTAAAKLKGVLSPIPPFIGISYEAEIDTENFLRQHFPTFTRLVKGAKK